MIRIEVWSDIVCPFCYIGKRHLEAALKDFDHADQVQVEWKAFELDPEAKREPGVSLEQRLARKYGESVDWAKKMHADMTSRGLEAGVSFVFDRAIPANTFDAHRLAKLAASRELPAEEQLFQAYFTDGQDLNDRTTLERIGHELGLRPEEVGSLFSGDTFAAEVRRDEDEARKLGITGVPFFLINRRYAISGAQPVEVLARALKQAYEESISRPARESSSSNKLS